MKKGIHPETYRLVAFKDMSNDVVFITRSCVSTKETIEIDGVEYPVVKLEISIVSFVLTQERVMNTTSFDISLKATRR